MGQYYDAQQASFDRAQREYENQEPPEGRVSFTCACCGEEVYEGDDCYRIGDLYYCEGCVESTTAPEVDDEPDPDAVYEAMRDERWSEKYE